MLLFILKSDKLINNVMHFVGHKSKRLFCFGKLKKKNVKENNFIL